ncbi:M15 family metallopeptidase [Modestobacter sp. VKM Ac-2984]|uniref:M15 family metallopeptidase n=1 Tax=Modestobacter sp. VKM Ac-2984 TaxID=3004138 RepID=UPI0022AA98B7|nr:M15 family metallopeptidase [Modestobacter sp. VKM Ac-2984]MCZ2817851.1 M15 family metallopeptidase [Modestobacter sp. VKM Ac-2984]
MDDQGTAGPARQRLHRRRRRLLLLLALVTVLAVAGAVWLQGSGEDGIPIAEGGPATFAPTPTAPTPTAPTPTALPPTPEPTTPPAFDRAQLSITDPASSWVVVNKARPLSPIDWAPADLVPIGNGYQLRAEAAQAMDAMIGAAAAQGLGLSVQSAYRPYEYQVGLFSAQVSRFGEERAEIQVARPGYSEHQTGLAADVGGGGCDIESCFATTAEGQWVAAHAHEFGWLVRYPEGRQDVTGFKYEPWHVRYVGVPLATEMQRAGVPTMEEFFGLPAAPGYPG